jgi:hypothetical protein
LAWTQYGECSQSAALESEPYVVIAHLPGFEDNNSLASQTCGKYNKEIIIIIIILLLLYL